MFELMEVGPAASFIPERACCAVIVGQARSDCQTGYVGSGPIPSNWVKTRDTTGFEPNSEKLPKTVHYIVGGAHKEFGILAEND